MKLKPIYGDFKEESFASCLETWLCKLSTCLLDTWTWVFEQIDSRTSRMKRLIDLACMSTHNYGCMPWFWGIITWIFWANLIEGGHCKLCVVWTGVANWQLAFKKPSSCIWYQSHVCALQKQVFNLLNQSWNLEANLVNILPNPQRTGSWLSLSAQPNSVSEREKLQALVDPIAW